MFSYQVIQEKEQQNKFIKGTKKYKLNNIMYFVLKENLKYYGWSIMSYIDTYFNTI